MSADAKFYCPKCQAEDIRGEERRLLYLYIDYWIDNKNDNESECIDLFFECNGCDFTLKIKDKHDI